MSNLKIITAYYSIYLTACRGFVSNYIDNGDGTFKCTVQRDGYDSSSPITNTEETLIGIKNIYDFKSHNLPTQLLLMSSDHNIFIPQKINEISIQEYLGVIYIVLYIAKKYGVLKTGNILLTITEPKNKDSTYDSIPFDTDENKAKKYIYGGYLYASDIRNNGDDSELKDPKRDELYWKNTANLNLSLYKLWDSPNSKFCLKINSTKNPINENLKVYDCSSSSSLSPDITIMPDIEDISSFFKKNMTYLVLGTIGVVVLISICCSVSFMFMKKGKKRK